MTSFEELGRTNINTVRKIYPTAVSLLDYVSSITNSDKASIVKGDDTSKFIDFVHTTVIVPSEARKCTEIMSLCRKDQQTSSTVRNFLNRFVAQTVKLNLPFKEQNCLSYGYRSKSSFTNCGMRSHAGLECYFVNTLHNIVSSPLWQQFSSRVGKKHLEVFDGSSYFIGYMTLNST